MLPSRPTRLPVAGSVSQTRSDAASGGTAATPFARLERQLLRGGARLGPERALADRVFSVVARSICSSADVTLEDTGQDDAAPAAGPLPAPQPQATDERPPGTPQACTQTSVVPSPPYSEDAQHVAGARSPRSVGAVASVQRATPPSRRVTGVGAPARPMHHHVLSRHRGYGRTLMLSVALAVLLVALTLNLLATPRPDAVRDGSGRTQGRLGAAGQYVERDARPHRARQPEEPPRDDRQQSHR